MKKYTELNEISYSTFFEHVWYAVHLVNTCTDKMLVILIVKSPYRN